MKFLFILFLTFLVTACSLDKKIERKNKKSFAKAPYDVIIIPGYPYQASNYPELFTIRLHWAKTLYEKGIGENIIFSGNAVHTPYTEGKLMKIFALEMGIPEENIFEENKALHTHENIKYGKKLAKKLGFKKIAFATDPYQFSYMTTLVNLLAPGTPLLTFPTDSMSYYVQPLPEINIYDAFVKDWNPKK